MARGYTIKDKVAEGGTLAVIANFTVSAGSSLNLRVPIVGTYTDAYIADSLSNRLITLKSLTSDELKTLIDNDPGEDYYKNQAALQRTKCLAMQSSALAASQR